MNEFPIDVSKEVEKMPKWKENQIKDQRLENSINHSIKFNLNLFRNLSQF